MRNAEKTRLLAVEPAGTTVTPRPSPRIKDWTPLRSMPELPEVERMRRDVEDVLAGKKITKVEAGEDGIVFSGITHTDFVERVTARTVQKAERRGKYFWITLDEGPHILLHCGMTGNIRVKGTVPMQFMDFAVKDEWPPRFVKFILTAEDGTQVAFSDARRLGRVRLVDNPLAEPPVSLLGFDPHLLMPPVPEFVALARKRNVAIKALLLDQAFSAGIGNWLADEILYQAGIHPEDKIGTLTDADLEQIHAKMKSIVTVACEAGADPGKFPTTWLFHNRWSKGQKQPTTPSGQKIHFVTVGGRTSAFVPAVQKPRPKRPAAQSRQGEEDEEEARAGPGEKAMAKVPARRRAKQLKDDDDTGPEKAAPQRRGKRSAKDEATGPANEDEDVAKTSANRPGKHSMDEAVTRTRGRKAPEELQVEETKANDSPEPKRRRTARSTG